ncbi:Deuterolysin metalloprotease family-domain-containing protein [Auriculariales sp. MPI-PUGE-AT-0066]|nr:Deuterolysin metalloprotease family-domain-containing protein [Auriculariales sp. MPI-PUGE-AT-0066]
MFHKAALTVFALVAAAFAAPSSPGGLSVKVSAPGSVTSVDGLKIVASVTNSGTEDVTVVNYGTVLDTRPTKSFTVTSNGKVAGFTGIKVSLNMNTLSESAYTTIKAGETVTVEHDISNLYDFESLGAGNFEIAPNAKLPVVVSKVAGSSPELTPFVFESTPTASVKVTGDVARRSLPGGEKAKRATVSCSNSSQASFISASQTEGKALASGAASYITANSTSSLFTAYYKTNSPSTVASYFSAVANENSSSRTLSCSDPYGVCDGVCIATICSITDAPLHSCSIFYNEVASSSLCSGTTVASRNIRGGTTLHELTHAVDNTDDVTYGCSADQALSASNQLINADNYNCELFFPF